MKPLNVTVWSEGFADDPKGAAAYPDDVNTVIAGFLAREPGFQVRKAGMLELEQGLTDELIDSTDVLLWWSHRHDAEIEDGRVERIMGRITAEGMGFIALHSGLYCKVMTRLVGPTCGRRQFREGDRERIWVIDRSHPIVDGLEKDYIDVPQSEMYSEPNGRPAPDELVFISWFAGGEVLRSGCTYRRGAGKLFSFAAGHEEYRIFDQKDIQLILANAVRWAAPIRTTPVTHRAAEPLEPQA